MIQFSEGIEGFVSFVEHHKRDAFLNVEILCFIDINGFGEFSFGFYISTGHLKSINASVILFFCVVLGFLVVWFLAWVLCV